MSTPPPDFLIVGVQKGGSYWLTALLDAHPEIRCFPSRPGQADGTGEAHLFDILARLETDYVRFRKSMTTKLGGWFADLVPRRPPATAEAREALVWGIRARFDEYCQQQRMTTGKPVVGEKTTETVHYPQLVEKLYPGICKVCILRDPRDRVVSFFFHQQRKGRLADGERLSRAHVQAYVERVRQDYAGLVRLAGPLHVLTYERLSTAPHDEGRRLLEFLHVDASSPVVERIVRAAAFERLAGRPQGQADATSHFRQGAPGDWPNHLPAGLAAEMLDALDEPTRRIEARFGLDLSAYREPVAWMAPDGAPEEPAHES